MMGAVVREQYKSWHIIIKKGASIMMYKFVNVPVGKVFRLDLPKDGGHSFMCGLFRRK